MVRTTHSKNESNPEIEKQSRNQPWTPARFDQKTKHAAEIEKKATTKRGERRVRAEASAVSIRVPLARGGVPHNLLTEVDHSLPVPVPLLFQQLHLGHQPFLL
jgi:hypothetical protein